MTNTMLIEVPDWETLRQQQVQQLRLPQPRRVITGSEIMVQLLPLTLQ
jgi:hypothetical protein